jgi:Tol biopolymer transport system component
VSLLGSGGMGDVYRALDTRLRRDVAVKVIRASLASDPDRLGRFRREAQLLAALNHPNVGTIHSFEEIDGLCALVLELVEGPTLADRIARGPMPVREALTIAAQIAQALEAAHQKGIVHRDLKPANVKITRDGSVKVLDFGLAKALAEDVPGSDEAPTLTVVSTRAGLVLGTPAYMSPEHVSGQAVDKRTDIWAFGCLLFEMLTGRPAFAAATVSDTFTAILSREPQWSSLDAVAPPGVRRLLRRCLEKDARRRLHDIADARIEIEDAAAAPSGVSALASRAPQRVREWAPWFIAASTLAVAAWLSLTRVDQPGNAAGRSVQAQRLTDRVGLEETPALSPDGKMVAFVAVTGGRRQLWVRLLAGGTPLPVTKDDVDHYGPRWSPDSGALIYFTPGAQAGDSGTIWEIPALGGPARRLVTALGSGDLSRDGTQLAFIRFRDGGIEMAIANRDGSNARSAARLPAALYSNPRWSPDGGFVAAVQEVGGATFATSLIVVDVATSATRRLEESFYVQGFAWLPDGSGLVVSSSRGSTMSYPPTFNLWKVPLDGGDVSQLTFGEASYEFPDLIAAGQLVVSRVRVQADVWRFPVTGAPQDNARQGVRITRQTGIVQTVAVSPDESEVVFLSDNGGHANVWTARVSDGAMRPVTREFDPRVVVAVPVWSPRGSWINFLSTRNSTTPDVTLWMVRPDGSEARDLGVTGAWACWSADEQWLYFSILEKDVYKIKKVSSVGGAPILVRDDNAIGCQATPDGSGLYYARILTLATGAWDFELRRAESESGPSSIIATVSGARVPASASNFHAFLSPDGRWLAIPLLDGSTTNLWAISTAGGGWRKLLDFGERNVVIARRIAWSATGRHVYASVSDVDADIVMLAGLLQ